MKRFATLLALTACLPLFADQEIALQPGTSFELNGTRVRCLGSDTHTPKCSVSRVSQAALDYYNVYVGSSRWGVVLGFDNAVKTVVELKQAGFCS